MPIMLSPSELRLAQMPCTPEQQAELNARIRAAERGDASYHPWEQVRESILAELRSRRP
jgi:hypothetical protein